jgi:hypothetical protein
VRAREAFMNALEVFEAISDMEREREKVENNLLSKFGRTYSIASLLPDVVFSAEVPKDILQFTRPIYPYEKAVRNMVDLIKRRKVEMVDVEISTATNAIYITGKGKLVIIYTTMCHMVDILLLVAIEKHGKVITKLKLETEKRLKEMLELHDIVSRISATLDAVLG